MRAPIPRPARTGRGDPPRLRPGPPGACLRAVARVRPGRPAARFRAVTRDPAGVRAGRPAARFRAVTGELGQASAEFVALLPLCLLLLAGAWQLVLAGDALWNARVAARAAARAQAVGGDPRAAALAHLPTRLEHALRVRAGDDGDVRVSLHVPSVLGALDVGRVSATARFERQGG